MQAKNHRNSFRAESNAENEMSSPTFNLENSISKVMESFLQNKSKKLSFRATTILSREKTFIKKSHEETFKDLVDLNVGTRMSLGSDGSYTTSKVMDIDEYVAIVHLTNLYIAEMPQIACSVIETQLTKLNLCSDLFFGNLARIHALCLQSAFITKLQKFKSHQVKLDDLKDSLAAIEALIGKSS